MIYRFQQVWRSGYFWKVRLNPEAAEFLAMVPDLANFSIPARQWARGLFTTEVTKTTLGLFGPLLVAADSTNIKACHDYKVFTFKLLSCYSTPL